MNRTGEQVKAERIQQFWGAYRSCVERQHVSHERSGFYVRWAHEFVGFLPEKKLQKRWTSQ